MIAPVVAVCVLGAALAQAQAPPARDTRAVAAGTATLSGVVLSDESEPKPVRRARVSCSAPELTEGLTAITDDRGRFACERLPAGRYTVSVSRDGWVATSYGAKRPLRPGTAIRVTAGDRVEVAVRMMRGAVITGTLIDDRGQPAVGATVVALRSMMERGARRLVALGAPATSDDRGVYRIFGLPPGDYLVGATPSTGSAASQDVQLTTDLDVRHARAAANAPPPPERRVAFATTYFPGTPQPLQASPIALEPGAERGEVDFALPLVTTARVEGSIVMPDGAPPPPSTQLTLVASGQSAFAEPVFDAVKTTRPAGDGTFAFTGVAPGVYTLLARAATPSVLWASTEIAADGEPISGVSLALQPGLTIAGSVRATGSQQAPALTSIKVAAVPFQSTGGVSLAPPPAAVDRDGRFVVSGVPPGRYRLDAIVPGAARGGAWQAESIVVDAQDAMDTPIDIGVRAVADAVVTLTDRLPQLSGSVRPAAAPAGYTVVLFPEDPRLWLPQSRRIRGTRAGDDGAYVFRNLPPGRYLLAVTDDVEDGEWFDAAFLQRLAGAAIHVTLANGERKTQDLLIGPGS